MLQSLTVASHNGDFSPFGITHKVDLKWHGIADSCLIRVERWPNSKIRIALYYVLDSELGAIINGNYEYACTYIAGAINRELGFEAEAVQTTFHGVTSP